MRGITNNEMMFVLGVFKSPRTQYNANSLAQLLGITRMGALKIAKKLEKERIISSEKLGQARFYRINPDSGYARQYVSFLLKMEAEQAHPYVKSWVAEIRKIKSADAAILFGSVLRKHKEARDIDAMLITGQKRFKKLKKEIEEIDKINTKKIHPMYQTKEDFARNIKNGDKPLLDAAKGICVFGEDLMIELMCA